MASIDSDGTDSHDEGRAPGRRWLLVDGFDDPFITRVALDVGRAARNHNAELVVLGEEWGETSPFLRLCRHDMARRGQAGWQSADPNPIEIDLEVAFRQAAGMPSRTRGEVRFELGAWRREASCVVDTLVPDLVIVWNGLLHLRRVYAQVVRDRAIPVLFAERGLLPDTFYLDPEGIGPESRLWRTQAAPTAADLAVFQARLGEAVAAGRSGWPQPPLAGADTLRRALRIPPQRRVVLFVAQVESDANLLLFSRHFRTGDDAIRWCLAGLTDQEYLLVKPHPKSVGNAGRYPALLGKRGGIALDAHIMDAVGLADVVVTINSTVALEASLQGKPVLVLEPTLPGSAAFATVRDTGASAHEAIAHCREEHAHRGTAMRRAALAVGSHLDAASAHLANLETTTRLLNRVLPPHTPGSPTRPSLASVQATLSAGATLPRCARGFRRRAYHLRAALGQLFR